MHRRNRQRSARWSLVQSGRRRRHAEDGRLRRLSRVRQGSDVQVTDAVNRQLSQILSSVRLLLDKELVVSALIILYAAIDGLSWLQRADVTGDSTSDDFRRWVKTYLLVGWRCDVTADDLCAARCAVLHSQAAESRHSRTGRAPEIWYGWGVG